MKMDINNYKNSGILELFVLGNLTEDEEKEVLQALRQYPELRKELEKIEEAIEAYGQAHAVAPSPGLEASILSRVSTQVGEPSPTPTERSPGSSGRRFRFFLISIAIAASVAMLIWVGVQQKQLNDQKQQFLTLEQEYQTLQNTCEADQQRKEKTERILALYKDPNTQPVVLKGTEKTPGAAASVIWNPEQRKAFMDIANLPAVPTGKQYQLWAIVDGTPVDMGVFDLAIDDDNFIEVPFIEQPQAFAVTLEPEGGNPTPTLEEMIVIGNV